MKAEIVEDKICKWINDNSETMSMCTREEAMGGCTFCQKFYKLLDEYASTKAEEEAKEFMKWHNINHRENLQLPDSYYDELYNQYKQQP